MSFVIHPLSPERQSAMRGVSWHESISSPGLDELRSLHLLHVNFQNTVQEGELITSAALADKVIAIFEDLFAMRFPIASIRPVCEFAGDDGQSMAANNSSCFNSRRILNTDRLSAHAYGRAIDINPVQNPVIREGRVRPSEGKGFVDRSIEHPGLIRHGDRVWQRFVDAGWKWGGDWTEPIDYHHFYLPDEAA